ncbi:hypothetical protein Tco_1255502 [Tanacetum coccineum]
MPCTASAIVLSSELLQLQFSLLLGSDDERTETDGSEKAEDKKAEDDKDANEKAGEEQDLDDQAGKVHAEVCVPEPQLEKPTVPLPILKDPFEAEVQSMVDVPIHKANPDV